MTKVDEQEETVIVVVPHDFKLLDDKQHPIMFRAGVQDISKKLADHWYVKANGVVPYQSTKEEKVEPVVPAVAVKSAAKVTKTAPVVEVVPVVETVVEPVVEAEPVVATPEVAPVATVSAPWANAPGLAK